MLGDLSHSGDVMMGSQEEHCPWSSRTQLPYLETSSGQLGICLSSINKWRHEILGAEGACKRTLN
jgi:hypothetical protein